MKTIAFALFLAATFTSCTHDPCPVCTLAIENTESAPYIVTVQHVDVEPFTMQPGAVEFVEIPQDKSVLVTGYFQGTGNDFQEEFRCGGECGFVRAILRQQ